MIADIILVVALFALGKCLDWQRIA